MIQGLPARRPSRRLNARHPYRGRRGWTRDMGERTTGQVRDTADPRGAAGTGRGGQLISHIPRETASAFGNVEVEFAPRVS